MSWNNKVLVRILGIFLGLVLVVFGLNGFFSFFQMPPPPAAAAALFGALAATGYFMPVVKVFEIVIGLSFLFNKYTKLATVMLVPLSLSFVLFHVALAPAGGLIAYITAIINVYFICLYKDTYKPLLK
jgi:putative oxidoreductase